MPSDGHDQAFQSLNPGYNSVFQPRRLSIGLVVPIETYAHGPVPTMARHAERVRLAEQLGFAAVWLRDVPFNVPSFGDAGQTFDPFVYLGFLAAQTDRIALGVSSIILPLRHPAHVAKAAATADALSNGRLILGVASGDRSQEFPALNMSFPDRGARFRDSFEYIRKMADSYPDLASEQGTVTGMDMLPKPVAGKLPLLITGGSQQSPEWSAANADGWMTYPRGVHEQARVIADWRARIPETSPQGKPVMQPLYVDIADDPDTPPSPLHLGFRSGVNALRTYLKSLEDIGINHVALNIRFNTADTEQTMQRIADELLPDFTPDES